MGSTTLGGVLAAVATVVAGVATIVAQTLVERWLERAGRREVPPYRRRVIDGWGCVTITAVVVAAILVAVLVGTAVAWIVGGVASIGCALIVWWWGWRRMPLLTWEARDWLETWLKEKGDWGGLSYQLASVGLAERTYTVQGLSRVGDVRTRKPGDASLEEVLAPDDLLATGADVLVTGEGGVGKSTNLRHFGSAAARQFWADATRRSKSAAAPSPGWLPVLLAARGLVDKASVEDALGAPPEMFTRAPAPGAQWLVLVDAVDEVLNEDQRQQVWDLLLGAVLKAGPRRFMITSRSIESNRWRDLGYRDVAHYQLHPFTDDQLRSFGVRHQTRMAKPDDTEQAKTRNRADQFVEQVHRQGLLEVVRLPLLAKLAADMYFDHQSRDLPMRRVDLYEYSIVQWLNKFDEALQNQVLPGVSKRERGDVHSLLDRMDKRYKAVGGGRAEILRKFLTELAAHHTKVLPDAIDRSLIDTAAVLLDFGREAGAPAVQLAIGRVLEATGLVRYPYHDAQFWHQTFAEYLSAPLGADWIGMQPRHWGRLLGERNTRPITTFIFHFLSIDDQNRIITALTDSTEHLLDAAKLAAEGVCTTDDANRIVDLLWHNKPEAEPNSSRQRHDHADWWQTAEALVGHPTMCRRLDELRENQNLPFCDRVNATSALARHGGENRWSQLEEWVHSGCANLQELTFAAEALVKVDRERGTQVLLELMEDAYYSPFTSVDFAEVLIRFDRKCGTATMEELARGRKLRTDVRLDVAEALSRIDLKRGLKLLEDFSGDTALIGRYRWQITRPFTKTSTKSTKSDSFDGVELLERLANDSSLKSDLRVRVARLLLHNDAELGLLALEQLIADDSTTYADRVRAERAMAKE